MEKWCHENEKEMLATKGLNYACHIWSECNIATTGRPERMMIRKPGTVCSDR